MNKIIQSLLKEIVQIEVSGKQLINGSIIDLGSDMIVLFNGRDFVYVPITHIQNFSVDRNNENNIQDPTRFPGIITEENKEDLSFGDVLSQAKGKYVEIYVTGGQSLHGCITSVMDNYFVFQSPIYKTMYIAIRHLKWLIPYFPNEGPYGLDNVDVLGQSDNKSLASTFEVQVKKLENNIAVFNIGGNKSHIGKIINVEAQIVENQTARRHPVYLNLHHIKTLHPV